MTDWQTQRPTETIQNSLIQASGKLVLIDKLLPKLKESGHKVCVGDQYDVVWSRTCWVCCVALPCCLYDLAGFFLPSVCINTGCRF